MIDDFRGEYWFLSNFFPCKVEFDGVVWPSSEHAYQAAKTFDPAERKKIQHCGRAGIAKKLGYRVEVRDDWEDVKLGIMRQIVEAKFRQNPILAGRLLETGDEELVEGNWWNDRYWGICDGRGENHLGKILMTVRDQLRQEQNSE